MANKACKFPFIKALASRQYAVAVKKSEVDNQVLGNHMTVASVPSSIKGLCKVAVVVRAGSRYETNENKGVSHLLRSAFGLTTNNASLFSISRGLDKIGSSLSATSDRETITYTLNTTADNLSGGLEILKSALTKPKFYPWELKDIVPKINHELSTLPPAAIVLDLVHQAAFRTGLGNSLYLKPHNLKKICSETLHHYVNNRFQSSKMAVVGVGVVQPCLIQFAESLGFPSEGGSSAKKGIYYGGEIRVDADSPLTHTVIANEGSSLANKDVFTLGVLRHALGAGPRIKWGSGNDCLSKALAKSSRSAEVTALNISHSDAGLFGILISTLPENTEEVISLVMQALKEGVTEADVARGKAQLKAQVLYEAESAEGTLTDLANQTALLGGAKAASQLLTEIDSVTVQQVQNALQKFMTNKKSLATYGDPSNVPYLNEL